MTDEQLARLVVALALLAGWADADAIRLAKFVMRIDPTSGDTRRPTPIER